MSEETRGRFRSPLWWVTVGLAALMALTGSVSNAVAAGSAGGWVAGVLVAVAMPGLLLLCVAGLQEMLRRFGPAAIFGDGEGAALPVACGVGAMLSIGTALVFIGQSVREFAVLGGIPQTWAWVFPFALEAVFAGFAVAFVVAGARADSVQAAEVTR